MSKFFKIVVNRSAIFIASMLVLAGAASAQEQTVTGTLSVAELSAGQSTVLTVTYNATDDALVTGLGLRLHYDSSVLSVGEVGDLLREGRQGSQFKDDTTDADGDASTDKYLLATWADTNGEWPYDEAQPVTLFTLPMTAISGFNGSTLKFTASSVASGYTFAAADVAISKIPGTVSTLSDLTASYPAFVTAASAINIPEDKIGNGPDGKIGNAS